MAEITGWLADFAELIHLGELIRSTLYAFGIYALFVLVVFTLEQRAGAPPGRYASRHFINDIAYTLFYRGGLFGVLVLAGVTNAMNTHAGFLKLNLLHGLPWPVGLALFWIGGDFLLYWLHRLEHANRFLWAFHSVHHSQSQMTLLTAWRRHPLETLITDILVFIVIFPFLLGVPTRGWMPLAAVVTCLQTLHHSQLNWRYGWLGRLVVSPHFHAFHHSVHTRHATANFGMMFSCWDHMFGTAVEEPERPDRYGVEGIDFHESLPSQFLTPFRLAWRWRHHQEQIPGPVTPPRTL